MRYPRISRDCFGRRVIRGVALVLTFSPALAATGSGEPRSPESARLAVAVSAIERAVAASPKPGLVIGITDRNETLAVIAHGFSDLKAGIPITAESRFALGSVSKSFTAAALMQLADEGRFDPHKPVREYLPAFSLNSKYAPIAGSHLLSMTSGLPSYLGNVSSSRFAILDLHDFEPAYAPGEHWWYSNTGFQILGYVLEQIEGAPYRTIIQRRILDALGMSSSVAVLDDSQRARVAVSYGRWPYDGKYVEQPWFEYAAGDGSVVSTAPDMCRYLRFILNHGTGPHGRLLTEKRFVELITPVLKGYAYGLVVREENGDTIVSHAGQIAGFEDYFEVHMMEGFGVVFLSNAGIGDSMQKWVPDVVRSAYRGEKLTDPPANLDDSRQPDVLDYRGTYRATAKQGASSVPTIEFITDGGRLLLTHGDGTIALEPMGVDAFRTPSGNADGAPFFFSRAEGRKDGPVLAVSHGAEWFAKPEFRGSPVQPPPYYAEYVGHYENHDPEGPDVRVFVKDGRLMMTNGGMYVAPGAFQQPLEPLDKTLFRIGSIEYSPERALFDSITDGHALRLFISGVPLYRMDTP